MGKSDNAVEELNSINTWKIRQASTSSSVESHSEPATQRPNDKNESLLKKFNELKAKAEEMRFQSSLRQQKTELQRSKRLVKRAMKDPFVKRMVENKGEDIPDNDLEPSEKKEKWKDIKPYLTINNHLHGPISHGDVGPKTELESKIDDCIKDDDLETAEVLSDTLANREFAVKIDRAFAAKRYAEVLSKEEALKKAKRLKKLRWGFEPKQRWQMKGSM